MESKHTSSPHASVAVHYDSLIYSIKLVTCRTKGEEKKRETRRGDEKVDEERKKKKKKSEKKRGK